MIAPNAPAWLTARPIAHRGLHDRGQGRIENSAGAARAAIDYGFAIECDVQLTRDGDAVVFHDFDLGRLTAAAGPVTGRTSAELQGIGYRESDERLITLAALLDLIDGRVPLICEIKSRFDGDLRLTDRVRALVAGYGGPLALKSFDPAPIAHLRQDPPCPPGGPCPLGMVAEARYDDAEWDGLSDDLKRDLAAFAHVGQTQPDFLSFHVKDLPHPTPTFMRVALGRPVMSWTVRDAAARAAAERWADQMVFEGFLP